MKKYVLIGASLISLVAVGAGCADTSTDEVASKAPAAAAKDVTVEKAEAKPEPPAQPAEPELTSAQENAVESAQDYLEYSGFSRKGLIQQLSFSAGEGFSKADATFAVNHVDVNWNEEAVESAQDYLDYSSFSRDGLTEQLSSSAGDGFTLAQAQYAVDQVY